jgi:hypothetical protein
MFGHAGPTRTTSVPSAASTASKSRANLASRSMIRCVARRPHSPICIEALRACCVTHAESGLAVGAETITLRVPTWMKKRRYRSTKPQAVRVRTERKSAAHSVAA